MDELLEAGNQLHSYTFWFKHISTSSSTSLYMRTVALFNEAALMIADFEELSSALINWLVLW